jgi:nitric oxide reductase NorD protein
MFTLDSQQSGELAFVEIQDILQIFLDGLSGQRLKLESKEIVFTDTETLFLPSFINRFAQAENNFLFYKTTIAHLWAQINFGTWRLNLTAISSRFSHRDKAVRMFHTLERLRLDACLARELPGLYRDMGKLLNALDEMRIPLGWESIAEQLAQTSAQVETSYQLLETVYPWPVPEPVYYQGMLLPERAEQKMLKQRSQRKSTAPVATKQIPKETTQRQPSRSKPIDFMVVNAAEAQSQLETSVFHFDERLNPFSETSLSTNDDPDYASVPHENLFTMTESMGEQKEKYSTEEEPSLDAFYYPEWDYRQQRYRKSWCTVREMPIEASPSHFVAETLQQYRGLLKQLRRTFEALRGDDQSLKRQSFGEDIDLDALVTTLADAKCGLEMSERVFVKSRKLARHVAVMFMVDMSGSTKGWINQAERESLVLLCEVLKTLGDQYAIYGFSGTTRTQCEIYPIKRFTEPYTEHVQHAISSIMPHEYTRMGVAIRHLTYLFRPVEAQVKLLITLSDGKPDDDDEVYGGLYGIEDTRQALLEAQYMGIHPFCITIDTEARTYLPRMYSTANYVIIDKVQQLPLRVADIYRKLTT